MTDVLNPRRPKAASLPFPSDSLVGSLLPSLLPSGMSSRCAVCGQNGVLHVPKLRYFPDGSCQEYCEPLITSATASLLASSADDRDRGTSAQPLSFPLLSNPIPLHHHHHHHQHAFLQSAMLSNSLSNALSNTNHNNTNSNNNNNTNTNASNNNTGDSSSKQPSGPNVPVDQSQSSSLPFNRHRTIGDTLGALLSSASSGKAPLENLDSLPYLYPHSATPSLPWLPTAAPTLSSLASLYAGPSAPESQMINVPGLGNVDLKSLLQKYADPKQNLGPSFSTPAGPSYAGQNFALPFPPPAFSDPLLYAFNSNLNDSQLEALNNLANGGNNNNNNNNSGSGSSNSSTLTSLAGDLPMPSASPTPFDDYGFYPAPSPSLPQTRPPASGDKRPASSGLPQQPSRKREHTNNNDNAKASSNGPNSTIPNSGRSDSSNSKTSDESARGRQAPSSVPKGPSTKASAYSNNNNNSQPSKSTTTNSSRRDSSATNSRHQSSSSSGASNASSATSPPFSQRPGANAVVKLEPQTSSSKAPSKSSRLASLLLSESGSRGAMSPSDDLDLQPSLSSILAHQPPIRFEPGRMTYTQYQSLKKRQAVAQDRARMLTALEELRIACCPPSSQATQYDILGFAIEKLKICCDEIQELEKKVEQKAKDMGRSVPQKKSHDAETDADGKKRKDAKGKRKPGKPSSSAGSASSSNPSSGGHEGSRSSESKGSSDGKEDSAKPPSTTTDNTGDSAAKAANLEFESPHLYAFLNSLVPRFILSLDVNFLDVNPLYASGFLLERDVFLKSGLSMPSLVNAGNFGHTWRAVFARALEGECVEVLGLKMFLPGTTHLVVSDLMIWCSFNVESDNGTLKQVPFCFNGLETRRDMIPLPSTGASEMTWAEANAAAQAVAALSGANVPGLSGAQLLNSSLSAAGLRTLFEGRGSGAAAVGASSGGADVPSASKTRRRPSVASTQQVTSAADSSDSASKAAGKGCSNPESITSSTSAHSVSSLSPSLRTNSGNGDSTSDSSRRYTNSSNSAGADGSNARANRSRSPSNSNSSPPEADSGSGGKFGDAAQTNAATSSSIRDRPARGRGSTTNSNGDTGGAAKRQKQQKAVQAKSPENLSPLSSDLSNGTPSDPPQPNDPPSDASAASSSSAIPPNYQAPLTGIDPSNTSFTAAFRSSNYQSAFLRASSGHPSMFPSFEPSDAPSDPAAGDAGPPSSGKESAGKEGSPSRKDAGSVSRSRSRHLDTPGTGSRRSRKRPLRSDPRSLFGSPSGAPSPSPLGAGMRDSPYGDSPNAGIAATTMGSPPPLTPMMPDADFTSLAASTLTDLSSGLPWQRSNSSDQPKS